MMIRKLYDLTIAGELLGHIEDTQETKEAAARLEGFVEGVANKEAISRITALIADYANKNGEQFFALGFEVARQLFMDGGAGAIN